MSMKRGSDVTRRSRSALTIAYRIFGTTAAGNPMIDITVKGVKYQANP
jgi:hypothetical protein